MDKPYILHMLTPDRNVSPFDVNMAIDAGWSAVAPYSGVTADDITALTQDAIFSRGPKGVRRTGLFIGGRDMFLALDMFEAAQRAMVPPFQISVFADPSGAFTTAAGMLATVERQLAKDGGLAGKRALCLGGTGPVGMTAAILAAQAGARPVIISRDAARAHAAAERCTALAGAAVEGGDQATKAALLGETEVVFAAGAAGVEMLSDAEIDAAPNLQAAADVNAVPPSGIAGLAATDDGSELRPGGARGIGALAVGNVKYQAQHRLLKRMRKSGATMYLHYEEACKVARAELEKS